MDTRNIIASRAAALLSDGDFVNLGIGIPTLCANYVPEGVRLLYHSENGIVGMGPAPDEAHRDKYIVDAGSSPASIVPGGWSCDLLWSFTLMRGGHLDKAIIGALQVDRFGNFASWEIPGRRTYGMGGAMDLAVGVKTLIVAMEHCQKDGTPKILDCCTYPLTGAGCVKYIITELCTFRCENGQLILTELEEGVSVETVIEKTGAPIVIPAAFEALR